MQGRRIGLGAVKNLAREAAPGEQLGERHEIGMRFDLVGLQGRPCDFRRLRYDVHIRLRIPALGLDGAQQHAVRGRG